MVVHNISKHCSTSHFLWFLVTDVTPDFASLMGLGHTRVKVKSERRFKTERFESFENFSKNNG